MRTGIPDDLDLIIDIYSQLVAEPPTGAAIELQEEVLRRLPPDDLNRSGTRSLLALGLQARYRQSGDPADLDQAIQLLDEAADGTPMDSPQWPGNVTNVAHALLDRYEREHRTADLDWALEILELVGQPGTGGRPGPRANS